MGLFGHDDENKPEEGQGVQPPADNGQVPTDGGAAGGADDVQGAVPPAEPPVEPSGDPGVPGAGDGEDDQTPPAPQQ